MHHWRGTNEDDEPLCDGVRLDLLVLELAVAGIVFRLLPYGFFHIFEFIG